MSVPDTLGAGKTIAYTRDGQFTLNSDGQIVLATDNGRKLDPPITVSGDYTSISIDSNGEVSVQRPTSTEPDKVGQILLTNFINPQGLKSVGENLYVESSASGPPVDGNPGDNAFGQIASGQYEGSNVDPTTELVHLIQVQRAFEMNSNSIRAADQTLQAIAQLHR